MTTHTDSLTPLTDATFPISPLQGDAWAAWNASYHTPARDVYETVGRALYHQDMHERITTLLARSDAQNAAIDTALSLSRSHS